MRKYLLPTALLLGLSFDVLFWKKVPGISFFIFVILCLLFGFFLLGKEKLIPAKNNFWLLLPILFLSVMTFIRREPFTSLLNYSLTLFFMAVLAMTYFSGKWIAFSLADYVSNFFHFIGGIFALPWQTNANKGSQQNKQVYKTWIDGAKPFIRGVLLAIPVLLVFTVLLSSADLIFAQRVTALFANLKLENLPEYLFRCFLILAIVYFFIGVILFAAMRSDNPRLLETDKPLIAPFLGFTETAIILSGVVLLFSAFVLIQFEYFFFGQANITQQGFTFSEYARRGFGELVVVAVFSIVLLKGLSVISKFETEKRIRAFTGLTISLVALVLIILVSAFQRLFLYESAYGFSRSRTYAHIFIFWLGVLLLAMVILDIIRRQRAFANIALAIVFGFSVTLNLLSVDRFIAQKNINRAVKGELLDTSYLSTLSSDAIPELVSNFSSDTLSPEIHEGIGAALVCFQQNLKNKSESEKYCPSFHLSDWIAERYISKVDQDLKGYRIIDNDWPIFVISPYGSEYSCQSNIFFD